MAKSIKVFVTDKNKFMELDLVPEDTNNTYDSEAEIIDHNNGSHEDAGFHWNDDEDRWETTYENFEWWDELANARHEAYRMLDSDDDTYTDFVNWCLREGYIDSGELDSEKYLPNYVKEYKNEVLKESKKALNQSKKAYGKLIKSGRFIKSGTSNFGSNNNVYGYDFPLVVYLAENYAYDSEKDATTNERDYDADYLEYEDARVNAEDLAYEMDIPWYDDYSESYLCHEPFMIQVESGYYEGLYIKIREGTDEEDVYSNDPRYGSVYEGGRPFTEEEMKAFESKINAYLDKLCSDYGWMKLGISARFDNGETWYSKINNSRRPVKSGMQHKDISNVSPDSWKDGLELPKKNFSNISIEVFNQDGDEVFYDFEDKQWYYYPTHKKALVKKWVEKNLVSSSCKITSSRRSIKSSHSGDTFVESYKGFDIYINLSEKGNFPCVYVYDSSTGDEIKTITSINRNENGYRLADRAKDFIDGYITSSRRSIKSSKYYIEYYGGGSDNGYVSYDNDTTIDLDNAMIFDNEEEANEWKNEHADEWNATLKVVPYPDFSVESSRQIKSARTPDPVQEELVDELFLCIINDGELYHQMIIPCIKNLERKYQKGIFDKEKAVVLWQYVADESARRYTKNFGTRFSVATRKEVAKKLNDYYEDNYNGVSPIAGH